MKITKYGHACLLLADNNHKLIIDPGSFTDLPDDLGGIETIIVTEEHYDHFKLENIQRIFTQNPSAKMYTTQSVCDQLAKERIEATVVTGKQTLPVSGFTVSFYETDHAMVYGASPCKSLSVKVNDALYYPSDSYQTIEDEVEVLALPTSGPWFKVEHGVDFMNAIKSKKIIATHNALNSEQGDNVTHHFLETHRQDPTRELIYLQPGESIEI
jgi:L-ascorbate metabolism protein UlaG (beta-lactamase superfamily)